jgi:hypothetical protein
MHGSRYSLIRASAAWRSQYQHDPEDDFYGQTDEIGRVHLRLVRGSLEGRAHTLHPLAIELKVIVGDARARTDVDDVRLLVE